MGTSLEMENVTPLLAVGLGAAASVGVWWLLRGKVDPLRLPPPDPECFQRPVARVAKLNLYPVKSCHRIEVDAIECLVRGFAYDRSFVFVNKGGQFLSQRRIPSLAQIQPRLETPATGGGRDTGDGGVILHLTAPGMPELIVREPPSTGSTTLIRIWRMTGEGVDVGDEAASWISTYVKMEGCRMLYMSPSHKPRVLLSDVSWTAISRPGEETRFADFAPLLLASEASLEALNSKLDSPVSMDRFRPNIVLSGCEAHEEDSWDQVRIGHTLIVRNIKSCGRCRMTTVDQEEGQYTGDEPLVTLRKYRLQGTVYNCETDRRYGNSPLFGVHYAPLRLGDVRVGDTVFAQ